MEGRGRFGCRELGSGVSCKAVSGLALVINFPNELILMKLAHEKQEKNGEDKVDIALEAQLGGGFSDLEANRVVSKNFYCKWGIHELKMTKEKMLLVGDNYRLINERQGNLILGYMQRRVSSKGEHHPVQERTWSSTRNSRYHRIIAIDAKKGCQDYQRMGRGPRSWGT